MPIVGPSSSGAVGEWQPLALGPKMVNSAFGETAPQARLEGQNVRLRGSVAVAAAQILAAGEEVALLPVGLRPKENLSFGLIGFAGLLELRVVIGLNGKIRCGTANMPENEAICFDGITFQIT